MPSDDKKKLPIIGITTGDINGIGPEVIMNLFSDERLLKRCIPVIYGSTRLFTKYKKLVRAEKFRYDNLKDLKDARTGRTYIYNVWEDDANIEMGQQTEIGGKKAFESLEAATNDLYAKKIDAMITAPINKKNIQQEGFEFPGHTEYLAQKAGDNHEHLMLMTTDELKIGVVTGHIPLSEVKSALTTELIVNKCTLLNKTLKKDFGIQKPKIALLGVNPHAGDNGLLGKDEEETIIPALEQLREKNILALGPFSADGFFGSYEFKHYDAVLAMYHDQGLIPFKTISFERGVNFTAGLPVIRTSPDHGTAYGIVGKGKASTTSFREALYLACDIHKQHTSSELVTT